MSHFYLPLCVCVCVCVSVAITIQFTSSVFAADYDPTIGKCVLYLFVCIIARSLIPVSVFVPKMVSNWLSYCSLVF